MMFPLWLNENWQMLIKYKEQCRVPQALLIVGNKGVGKGELSHAFSQILLCKTQTACGHCHACRLFLSGNHPDFLVVAPQEHGQIKIDQIRDVVGRLSQTAQQGGYRIVIIQDAHAMNTASANALLKTLEEPGSNTILMLLTDRDAFIPATLRSRCQILKMKVDVTAAKKWLMSQSLSEEKATELLMLAENAPFLAARFVQSEYANERDTILKIIFSILKNEMSVVKAASTLLEKPLDETLFIFQTILIDLVRIKMNFMQDVFLKTLSEFFSLKSLYRCYDTVLAFRHQLQSQYHLNATLLLENVLISFRSPQ